MLLREGLERVLGIRPEVEVVASCADLPSLLEAVGATTPDVVLTDIRMPPTNTDEGVQAANLLRGTHPTIGVIVLSQYAEPAYALALFELGSQRRGYLLKERVTDGAQLVAALEAVAGGGSVVDPQVVDVVVAARSRGHASPLGQLTPREMDVLAQVAQGKSNAAIGESLVLTKRAVEKHVNSIFLKLGLSHAQDVSQRVMATLLFLADSGDADAGA